MITQSHVPMSQAATYLRSLAESVEQMPGTIAIECEKEASGGYFGMLFDVIYCGPNRVPTKDAATYLRNLADNIVESPGTVTIESEDLMREITNGFGMLVDVLYIGPKYRGIRWGIAA